jgi:hypothetical protein
VNRYGSLLVMLGLLLGPGYYLFCEYLSGEPGPSFTLTERAARWTLSDGTILRFTRGRGYKPVSVELTPDMNRIAFRLAFEAAPGEPGARKAEDEYRITLLQADQPIFERRLLVKPSPGARTAVEAGRLEIFFPGTYDLLVEELGTPQVPLAKIEVQVRQRVETLFMPVMWIGIVLLVVGLALTLEPFVRRHTR